MEYEHVYSMQIWIKDKQFSSDESNSKLRVLEKICLSDSLYMHQHVRHFCCSITYKLVNIKLHAVSSTCTYIVHVLCAHLINI